MLALDHSPRLTGPRPMRVAIVAESFLPAVNGVTNSVLRTLEHMTARGHEMSVIAPGPGDDEYCGVKVERVSAIGLPGYDEVRVGSPFSRVKSMLAAMSPDVVHLAAPAMLGSAASRAAESLGIPMVAVFQTDLAAYTKRYRIGCTSGLVWSMLRRIHQRAAVTLAPSSAAMDALREQGVPNVERWMRGVDLERFNPCHRSEVLRAELAPRGEVVVGFVGRLAKEKQVHLLAPIADLPGVRLVIVGDGPERERLERRIPNATFLGFRTGRELSEAFASFDVFVHAGVDETFCQAVQEALASGTPVVAPAAGGPLDLVQHGTNGYLWSPDRPESLVEAVAELVHSPLRRARMAGNARSSVAHRTWTSVMDELAEHYARSAFGVSTARSLVA